jgi:RNA polymerase sigma-70 factor (ECF subfamily)
MDKDELYALVEKAIEGDEPAFEDLYVSQSKSILFGARSWLYDSNETEDAASEIVIAMYKSIARLKNPHAFKSWMQRIIMAVCVDINRKSKKDKALDKSFDIGDFEAVLPDSDADVNPEALATKSDEDSFLNAAIDTLPEAQKRALFLFYYEDMDYQDIARALKVSASTVSTNLMKARKKLKEALEAKGMSFTDLIDDEKSGKFATAVTGVLGAKVNDTVSSANVDSFVAATKGKLSAYQMAQGGVNKVASKTSYAKIVLAAAACSLVISGGIAIPHIIGEAEVSIDKDIAAIQQDVQITYTPEVDITFNGSGGLFEHINPTSATLVGGAASDKVVGWYIKDVDNNEVKSGQGSVVENVFEDLAPGNYSLSWDIQDENGITAQAVREFVIK